MANFSCKAFLLLLISTATAHANLSYDGRKVLRAKVEDEAQASALHQLSEIGIYDFWTEAVSGRTVDIRTSPEQTEQLGVWLGQHGITWNVMIEDVGVLMEAEKASSGEKSHSAHSMDWTSYHALEDIYGWFGFSRQMKVLLCLHENANVLNHDVPGDSVLAQPDSQLLRLLWRCPDVHSPSWDCLRPEVVDANFTQLMQGRCLGLILHLCT